MILDDLWNILIAIYNTIINIPTYLSDILNFLISGTNWVIHGLSLIGIFIGNLTTFVFIGTSLVHNVLDDSFSTNHYAISILSLLFMGMSVKVGIVIWNLFADLTIFGWKIPRIPL